MTTAPPPAPREWNAGTYHRVSAPQFAWGQAVLDRLIEAIGPGEMHAQDTGEDEEPREWSPI